MSIEIMKNLMRDFGAEIGIPDLQLNEEQRCNLMFDEVAVSFELSKTEESIYIYAYVGDAPGVNAESFYAMLLDANYIFNNTAGATLGVDKTTRKVVLIREEKLALMQQTGFESTVENFVNTAEYWKGRLLAPAEESDLVAPQSDQSVSSHAMKV